MDTTSRVLSAERKPGMRFTALDHASNFLVHHSASEQSLEHVDKTRIRALKNLGLGKTLGTSAQNRRIVDYAI
jgi:hypothetical protein